MTTIPRQRRAALGAAMAVPMLVLVLGASPSIARTTDPAAIDLAVAQFTGAPIGAVGGALQPADPRLRLAACPRPLDLAWHGRARALVRVVCEGAGGWQIFIAIRPSASLAAAATSAAGGQAEAALVKRGDPLTVVVRGNGFSIQQAGEASESGRVGEWIGVRTAREREPIRARIERPGLAVIELR